LGEFAEFEMGQAPPGSLCNVDGVGTVFVKAGEFGATYPVQREWTTKPLKYGRAGDVFICVVGATAGKLNLGIDCAIGRSVAAIRPSKRLDTKFLYYQLQPWVLRLRAASAGSAQGVISKRQLADVPVQVPELGEQRLVVAEIEKQFSRLDEAVANLKRVKAHLKGYTNGIYGEFFAGAPNGTLGDVLKEDPQNGLYLPKELYGKGVPILRIDDYQTGWARPIRDLKRVRATASQVLAWELREDDLVINRVNSVTHLGKCLRISAALSGAVFESNMMRIRLTSAALPKYVEYYFASPSGKKRLTENAKWAVNQASINQRDVWATPLCLPDVATQQRVIADIDRRLSIVRELEAEVDANLKRAQALRQAILAKAFSGAHA
jgi:type I restriction enzyme, S subunit